MYAVVGHVKIDTSREDEARRALSDVVVPQAKSQPGFVSGTWLRGVGDDRGESIIIFDSDEAARKALEQMRQGPRPGDPVTFVSGEVFEVVATA